MAMKIITPREFEDWLKVAKRGDRLTYYLGFLCHDRSYERTLPGGMKVQVVNKDVDNLAKTIWEAYENRRVLLVQEKVGPPGVYSYLAVRI